MFWVEFGLFLMLFWSVPVWTIPATTVKREADYTLDDSFWKEEVSPAGEVERLLKEYRQNQELVRNIGAHYYQIIYPVQLRHHEKMGISTREIGTKFPQRGHGEGGNYQGSARGRSRMGKHFHRTSLLIKAFNHKFRLDLELNTQLLAPNLVQKHFLQSGAEQIAAPEIEHCYYHGTVKDYPGATAAFHTCNGVSGVIHIGNETFVIHPFYGGDLSKHPHVIFEARTKQNKGCANSGNLEWRMKNYRKTKHVSSLVPESESSRYRRHTDDGSPVDKLFNLNKVNNYSRNQSDDSVISAHSKLWDSVSEYSKIKNDRKFKNYVLKNVFQVSRLKRDVREATKYIETAIILDKAMFEKRNGSTRADVVHDAIQVANIADLYFRTLNTRVSVVYIETWQGTNKINIDKTQDISRALLNFNDYTSRKMFKVDRDTTQLLTGETFLGGEAGMAVPETVCTAKSVGISVDVNTYEPHILAGTMAHMIGHNIGMGHDDGREQCYCRDWHGCIMAQSIVGLENVQPYKFSECSKSDYIDALRIGHGICLLNKPNEFRTERNCGNGIVEEGEVCDCGAIDECPEVDPCCDPITCKLTAESECASGPCCDNCRLRSRGVMCREAANECDLPEHCNGETGECPLDVHKKNGSPCSQNSGYCFNGVCPTLNLQCEVIWGYGGIAGDKECYEQFNSKGSINGHCGVEETGQYLKCEPENVHCGSLQCQLGNRYPVLAGMDQLFARTIIVIKGQEYECKSISAKVQGLDIPDYGLVRDGTPCGDQSICVNQTCTSIFPHIDNSKCPTNHNNLECSGHGVCSNINKCHCDLGWTGPDCSIQVEVTEAPATASTTLRSPSKDDSKSGLESQMEKKVTPYDVSNNNLSTLSMVFILVGVVKGVFICFALMAVCYRRRSTMVKYEPPYAKKPMLKKTSSASVTEDTSMDSANKILTFGNMPSYSRGDSHRVLFRPVNHMQQGANSRMPDHKMQQLKRVGVGSGSEDDPTVSGEEESVAFIDLPPNNLSKLPEKGILKKPGPYGTIGDGKEKWSEDSQSDNQEILSQSDNNLGEGGAAISEVERTLKSLNGYHEDILEALRTAASHSSHRPPGGLGMHTPSGSSSLLSEEILRKSLLDAAGYKQGRGSRGGSQEKICDHSQTHTVLVDAHRRDDDEDDELPPSCGPIRIRNLEDLIRQLEHHSARHMSPSGSEDIRMSETEADRHYRLEASDSQGVRTRQRLGEEEPRFVYGRYRHPSSISSRSHSSPHSHQHGHAYLQEEEGIYESADHDRGADCGDTPDSESDEFIQAQPALVRSASEEVVPGVSGSGNGSGSGHRSSRHRESQQQNAPSGTPQREYYPSPLSSSDSEDSNNDGPSTAPEYKH